MCMDIKRYFLLFWDGVRLWNEGLDVNKDVSPETEVPKACGVAIVSQLFP